MRPAEMPLVVSAATREGIPVHVVTTAVCAHLDPSVIAQQDAPFDATALAVEDALPTQIASRGLAQLLPLSALEEGVDASVRPRAAEWGTHGCPGDQGRGQLDDNSAEGRSRRVRPRYRTTVTRRLHRALRRPPTAFGAAGRQAGDPGHGCRPPHAQSADPAGADDIGANTQSAGGPKNSTGGIGATTRVHGPLRPRTVRRPSPPPATARSTSRSSPLRCRG